MRFFESCSLMLSNQLRACHICSVTQIEKERRTREMSIRHLFSLGAVVVLKTIKPQNVGHMSTCIMRSYSKKHHNTLEEKLLSFKDLVRRAT